MYTKNDIMIVTHREIVCRINRYELFILLCYLLTFDSQGLVQRRAL